MSTKFTPQRLLEMAADAEAIYKELSVLYPAGTFNDARNDARRLSEQALACAEWMEKSGHKELDFVGPFGDLPFKRKCRVRIRRGAMVHSLHPQSKGEAPAKVARVVTVHFVDSGYVDVRDYRGAASVRQPRLTWAGAGGYWCSVDANEAELVETPEPAHAA